MTPEGTDPEVVLKVRDEAPRPRHGGPRVQGVPPFGGVLTAKYGCSNYGCHFFKVHV